MNNKDLYSIFSSTSDAPLIMGILNLDPQSFYKASICNSPDEALHHVEKMLKDGMDILDIGSFSSRPGMDIPSLEEEKMRLMPFLKIIRSEFKSMPISIDTMRSEIADEAIDMGADIINDISGGNFDSNLPLLMVKTDKIYIAMHMRELPKTMQSKENTMYGNPVVEIIQYFSQKLQEFKEIGLHKVIIDPGFGFSKTLGDNYRLLRNLETFKILSKPILVGISRKSMISKCTGTDTVSSLAGTLAAEFFALQKGCNILRVHDVFETAQIISVNKALQSKWSLNQNE